MDNAGLFLLRLNERTKPCGERPQGFVVKNRDDKLEGVRIAVIGLP